MSTRRPGPAPKGQREQLTVRLPKEHVELYRARQAEQGYEHLGDYLAAMLAQAHDLDTPPYLSAPEQHPALPAAS